MKRYACLVADPAWSFGDKLPGKTRGAARNYEVMTVDDICGLARGGEWKQSNDDWRYPPNALAMCGKRFAIADDALLFLWRVASMPQEALDVVKAWGFEPKSEIVWVKTTGKKSDSPAKTDLNPPFVRGSDTSEAAAESVAGNVEALRAIVFDCICSAGERGRTCDAIERRLQMLHQTTSARVRDLALMGKIKDSGQRRKTRSGRSAVVWVKAPPGSERQPPSRISSSMTLHFGMGRYVRNCHETCVIAARGRATKLIENHSTRSVLIAPVPRDAKGKIIHSAKPPELYSIVEALCDGPRLELFAREGRPGWTVAGNAVGVLKG
jgi:N6-adenosine-specific RNA methylase IME4